MDKGKFTDVSNSEPQINWYCDLLSYTLNSILHSNKCRSMWHWCIVFEIKFDVGIYWKFCINLPEFASINPVISSEFSIKHYVEIVRLSFRHPIFIIFHTSNGKYEFSKYNKSAVKRSINIFGVGYLCHPQFFMCIITKAFIFYDS